MICGSCMACRHAFTLPNLGVKTSMTHTLVVFRAAVVSNKGAMLLLCQCLPIQPTAYALGPIHQSSVCKSCKHGSLSSNLWAALYHHHVGCNAAMQCLVTLGAFVDHVALGRTGTLIL